MGRTCMDGISFLGILWVQRQHQALGSASGTGRPGCARWSFTTAPSPGDSHLDPRETPEVLLFVFSNRILTTAGLERLWTVVCPVLPGGALAPAAPHVGPRGAVGRFPSSTSFSAKGPVTFLFLNGRSAD